jgi:hypothetical protein
MNCYGTIALITRPVIVVSTHCMHRTDRTFNAERAFDISAVYIKTQNLQVSDLHTSHHIVTVSRRI